MRTRSIGFASIVVLAAVAFTIPSLSAEQQTTARWEYLRLAPGLAGEIVEMSQHAYQACEATEAEWRCRDFKSGSQTSGDDGLRRALATLGAEGWELVSTVDTQRNGVTYPVGMTYLLKRQRP